MVDTAKEVVDALCCDFQRHHEEFARTLQGSIKVALDVLQKHKEELEADRERIKTLKRKLQLQDEIHRCNQATVECLKKDAQNTEEKLRTLRGKVNKAKNKVGEAKELLQKERTEYREMCADRKAKLHELEELTRLYAETLGIRVAQAQISSNSQLTGGQGSSRATLIIFQHISAAAEKMAITQTYQVSLTSNNKGEIVGSSSPRVDGLDDLVTRLSRQEISLRDFVLKVRKAFQDLSKTTLLPA